MKCLLTVPNIEGKHIRLGLGNNEFLGIQYIAASLLKNGFNCEIINAQAKKIGNDELTEIIIKNEYDMVGVSCPSQKCYIFAKQLIQLLRKKGFQGHITLGGFYATISYYLILDDLEGLDTIVLGEGELTFTDLVSRVFNKQSYDDIKGLVFKRDNKTIFSYPERIDDLDKLPFPVRDVTIIGDSEEVPEVGMNMCSGRFFRMIVGRGCYGRCSFCSIIDFYKPRRRIYRSARNVVDEIEYLVSKYGVNTFRFNDDIFYDTSEVGLKWVDEFVNEIKGRNLQIEFSAEIRADDIRKEDILRLKSVGLKKLSIGIESGVQRILDEMKKDYTVQLLKDTVALMRDCGIDPAFTFITIVPTMTFAELRKNYDFILELGCYVEKNLYNQLNVYTACGYEQILKNKGLLLPKENFYDRHNYLFLDKRVEHFANIVDLVVGELKKVKSVYSEMMISDSDYFYGVYNEYRERRKNLMMKVIYFILNDLENREDENICYEEYTASILGNFKDDIAELLVTK